MTDFTPEPLPAIDVEEFRKVVQTRRSIRRFTTDTIPEEVLKDCLELALLSANSSNLQPWEFHRVVAPEMRSAVVKACLSQNAAKTAAELIVIVARTQTWKRACEQNLEQWPEPTLPRIVENYYKKAAKIHYGSFPLDRFGIVKKAVRAISGLKGPMPRWPNSQADMELWATKSTALASQTLMLALRAHGYDSCPMEGFDEKRLRKAVPLPKDGVIVMVLAAGKRAENGVYHRRYRMAADNFIVEHR